jgi:hypothetical protein
MLGIPNRFVAVSNLPVQEFILQFLRQSGHSRRVDQERMGAHARFRRNGIRIGTSELDSFEGAGCDWTYPTHEREHGSPQRF